MLINHAADRPAWKAVLQRHGPLVLPSAADALTMRLIARAGFRACQIGGFSLAAHMLAVPDIDLEHSRESSRPDPVIRGGLLFPLVWGDEARVLD